MDIVSIKKSTRHIHLFYIVEEPTVGPSTGGTSNGGGDDPVPSPSICDCSVPEGDTLHQIPQHQGLSHLFPPPLQTAEVRT